MTNYIILALCVIIVLAYFFDVTSRFSKIPGVILLIALGIMIQLVSKSTGFDVPNLRPVLPVIGTLGLVMIVMEASMDIKLKNNKKLLIAKSVSSALLLLAVFTGVFSFVLVEFFGVGLVDSLLNAIPFGVISSSIAIPSAAGLDPSDKEFIVYESSFSDIFGIVIFDFILLNNRSVISGILTFTLDSILTVFIALLSAGVLGYLLHKTTYHINYVIILTFIILIYSLAKIIHLPALLLIFVFGLFLSNNNFLEIDYVKKFIDFPKFATDVYSFKKVLGELTFLVKSFFFIMFGYYTQISNLFNLNNLLIGLSISAGLFLFRWLFFKLILKLPVVPIVFFAPRGLITILLFLSIPLISRLSFVTEELVTIVILISISVMTIGSFLQNKTQEQM